LAGGMGSFPVIGVVGGQGGVGASRFAAALATAAGSSLLIDLDPVRGGIDVLLELEAHAGARWSGLRLAGGHLDPEDLLRGLPAWGDVAVLAADNADEPDPAAVEQLLEVARPACAVVFDLPRADGLARRAAVRHCDLVVLVSRADVAALSGARSVRRAVGGSVGLLLRGPRNVAPEAGELVGARLLGRWPARRADGRALSRIAAGVLDAVAR